MAEIGTDDRATFPTHFSKAICLASILRDKLWRTKLDGCTAYCNVSYRVIVLEALVYGQLTGKNQFF